MVNVWFSGRKLPLNFTRFWLAMIAKNIYMVSVFYVHSGLFFKANY